MAMVLAELQTSQDQSQQRKSTIIQTKTIQNDTASEAAVAVRG
jgi:hypothetical protein